VPGIGLDADEHGRASGRLALLEARGKFEAVRGHHAVVVVAGGDERGRVAHAGPETVQRRVGAEDAEIAALLPEVERRKADFNLEDSEVFAAEDDWLAVTEYIRAIASLKQGDSAGFKKHITEAFWLSPRQGAAFAPHIERMRLMDAMKAVKVDFDKKYKDSLDGKMVSLGEVLGDGKGLLLHFWSPWSRECEATLADFFLTAEHVIPKGVGVVSILPETTAKVNADAKAMLLATGKDVPGRWIVDSKKAPVSHQLKVQSVPVVVLLSADGRILYNGHPAEENFWKALGTLGPGILRPEMREEK